MRTFSAKLVVCTLIAGCVPTASGKPPLPVAEVVNLFMQTCVANAQSGADATKAFQIAAFAPGPSSQFNHLSADIIGSSGNFSDPALGGDYTFCSMLGTTDAPKSVEALIAAELARRYGADRVVRSQTSADIPTYTVSMNGQQGSVAVGTQMGPGNFQLSLKVGNR